MARIADLLAAGRTYSFEFFPPKTDSAQLSLGRAIGELEPLAPSFVSVTYGAGGSTRQRTHAVVSWMRKETTLTPMAHLTCQGHVRAEIRDILNDSIKVGGSTLGDAQYVDVDGESGSFQNEHRVYGRTGQRCSTCGRGWIRRTISGGRSTHYCPVCQH